jgi:hypothetical protein
MNFRIWRDIAEKNKGAISLFKDDHAKRFGGLSGMIE